MSKALVIKGASFAANKVETIVISQPIPCTGLSVSPTTASLTSIGATQQLTVTKTPADTTDTVTYESSNPEIATVSDTGLITSLGVGTVTITVMCGNQSATCSVVITAVINVNTALDYTAGYGYSGSIDLAKNKDWIGYVSSTYKRAYYSDEDVLGGYRAFIKVENAGKYLIPLPNGATKATATAPTEITGATIILADSATKSKASGTDGQCAAAVHAPYSILDQETDISGTTADGFVFTVSCATSTDIDTITGDITLTFS